MADRNQSAAQSGAWRSYFNLTSIPFYLVHAIAVGGVFWLGWSWSGALLALCVFWVKMFFVTGGYHRYFSHRSYKTSRIGQFVLAFGAEATAQKGVLWWAAHHRWHHKYSDKPEDLHSPVQRGFWWSHLGWILDARYKETRFEAVRDLARYPELRWLNRHDMVPPVLVGLAFFLIGGVHALIWGFFVSNILSWHISFTINSLSHVFGSRRYDTDDDSRNNVALALLTLGEGWHNNHHQYQSAACQGFRKYEIDITYYVLKALAAFGLVWDLRRPPAHVIRGEATPKRAIAAAGGTGEQEQIAA